MPSSSCTWTLFLDDNDVYMQMHECIKAEENDMTTTHRDMISCESHLHMYL